jgi:hypothetical protein
MNVHTPGRLGVVLFAAWVAAVVLSASTAFGKRVPPPPVAPVVSEGVRYEAPPFSNPCGQNGGCVVAFDDATGAQLWSLKVYCTQYNPNLESDVQDVFITSIVVNERQLAVTDEKGRHFSIDPATRQVSGDARGCQESGASSCSHLAKSPRGADVAMGCCLLGLLIIVRRSRIGAIKKR